MQKQLDERLKGLTGAERELEERAIAAELKAGEQVATQLGSIYSKQEEERSARKANGQETIADYLSGLFGSAGEK